jgi:hypothetical protein
VRAEKTLQKSFGRRELLETGAVAEGETGDGVREAQDDGKDPPRERRKREFVAKHDDE